MLPEIKGIKRSGTIRVLERRKNTILRESKIERKTTNPHQFNSNDMNLNETTNINLQENDEVYMNLGNLNFIEPTIDYNKEDNQVNQDQGDPV